MARIGSKYLMRANPALTTNVKLMVSSKYELFLESYDSNDILTDNRYKKFRINPDTFLSERIARFYKDLPIDLAFEVRNIIGTDMVQFDYKNQYDDIYYSGALNVENTKYVEEFQYNTTLKIDADKLPKYFFIFRQDGTGINQSSNFYDGDLINSKLIHTTDMREHTDLGKFLIKNYITEDQIPTAPFELNTNHYEFSKWHGYNYETGGTIARSLFIDDIIKNQMNDFEMEKFITDGFRKNGVICSNYLNMSHLFDDTCMGVFTRYEKDINGNDVHVEYKLNEYPFLFDMFNKKELNMSDFVFLLDNNNELIFTVKNDIPYRNRWKINRYSGFYADDIEHTTTISPYVTTDIIKDNPNIYIVDNVFVDIITGDPIKPFNHDYNETVPIYLKIYDKFYLVERTKVYDEINNVYIPTDSYHIITDEKINGRLMDFQQTSSQPIKIKYHCPSPGSLPRNYIYNMDDTPYSDNILENIGLVGKLIIEIYGKFYSLNRDPGNNLFYINTDDIIKCNDVEYVSKNIYGEFTKSTKTPHKESEIPYFKIYVIKFTQVEDFDFRHLYTDNANWEYEKALLTDNDLAGIDIQIKNDYKLKRSVFYEYIYDSYYKDIRLHRPKYKHKGAWLGDVDLFNNQSILPCSSEYSANGDLYMIKDLNLTDIWKHNQYVNKFVFSGSNDRNSLPYKFNNSFDYWGTNNKSFDILDKELSIETIGLDWFYTFGRPIYKSSGAYLDDVPFSAVDTNITPYNYEYYRTLNIDYDTIFSQSPILSRYLNFNYDDYLNNTKYDLLDYFLSRPVRIRPTNSNAPLTEHIKETERFAVLNDTDNSNGSLFLYKGLSGYIRYNRLSDINDIDSDSKTYLANDLNNYKMSAIFTRRETDDGTMYGKTGLDFVLNKHHKHLLICIYMYVGYGELTELEFRPRDHFYEDKIIRYSDGPAFIQSEYINSNLRTTHLNIAHIYDIMKNNYTTYDGFDKINYIILEERYKYTITGVNLANDIITLEEETEFQTGDYVEINGIDYIILEEINNKTLKIDNTIPNIININDILVKSISPKPFVFDMREYNSLTVCTDINELNTENSRIESTNKVTLSNDDKKIVVHDGDNILPDVLYPTDDDIYTIQKNSECNEYNIINRYDGLYEPKTYSLNLFSDKLLFKLTNSPIICDIYLEPDGKLIAKLPYNATDNISTYLLKYYKYLLFTIITTPAKDKSKNYISTIDEFIVDYINNEVTMILTNNTNRIVGNNNQEVYLLLRCDENVLFQDTSLSFKYNFGVIEEQIISKYDKGMLHTKDIRLLYPRKDEHGVSTINRNVFLSNWTDKFFYNKEKNNYELE